MADFPTRNYSKGDLIFEEGSAGNVAYIVKEGSVEISVIRKGQKIVLAILKPGAIFGEMALLLEERKRTASAKAYDNCELIVIYKDAFYNYLRESSVVTRSLITGLIDRLFKTTNMLVETDDLTFGITQILRLLNIHDVTLLDYDEAVNTFSRCFHIEPEIIKEKMVHMEKSNLLEFTLTPTGKKAIKPNRNIAEHERGV